MGTAKKNPTGKREESAFVDGNVNKERGKKGSHLQEKEGSGLSQEKAMGIAVKVRSVGKAPEPGA